MTTTKSYDLLNRLQTIASVGATSAASPAFDYEYNPANQRVRVTQADGSYWRYEYDALGQVRSGKRYWSDGTPVVGQQFEYAFDDIGNRTQTKGGGDSTGGNLRPANYSANTLNQYTSRVVPGTNDVTGLAYATATVQVNGSATARQGEYFAGAATVNNSTGSVFVAVTTQAVLTNTTNPVLGSLFFPKTPETFLYDADGNLKSDGRWTNQWDAENRLVYMETLLSVPTGAVMRLSFQYDWMGRRVSKVVQQWNGTTWPVTVSNRFLYDGWNLVAELNATNNALIRSYVWGKDLSDSEQGAGGVGGLLFVTAQNVSTNAVAYDANGNVEMLVDVTSGNASAQYEYGPFGEVVRASGVAAKVNLIRFSSKYA